ncbi:kinase-like domain-containing protein [Russula vinacea]|nr:kinase-like domain-containing protein [Russula vinacea]
MLQSSGKRAAFSPPPDSRPRPTKRQERSSSPEEGELDDADPPHSLHVSSPHLPSALGTPPPASSYSVKLKLPFKTKANPTTEPGAGAPLPNNFEDIEEGRSKENAPAFRGSWNGHTHTKEPLHRTREFRDRRRDRPHSGSSQGSPVGDYGRLSRSKVRARSRSRSTARSSSGSRSSSRKQTHRLPPHRARGSPSPLLARRRDVTPDSRDARDRYDSHPHSRYDSASSWCHDGRGQYRRDPLEDYFTGDYDTPRPPYRDYYDRGHERDPYGPRYESTRGRTVANDYRPVSPRQPSVLRCPRSPSPCLIRTPPQPRSPPPPTPPRSELQTRHSTISFLLPKKPPTHIVLRSPRSMSHPPSRSPSGEGVRGDEADVFLPEKVISRTSGKSKQLLPPHQPPRPIRPPLRRTREEEHKAYGRTFVGSGQQDDYDAMTKLGEGTFGEVHKAKFRPTGRVVALKRILMHNEKEGMPVTALREIKILKALKHLNVVELLDMFVVRGNGKDRPLSVYMVFPYMDHDLAGLLENDRVKLQPSQIKLYMKQLLEGTEYMHKNHILHRDMKAANLLISNSGSLRIADFGLARSYDPSAATMDTNAGSSRSKERRYTNCVVTRWYRPPELLLGARNYGGEIDIWGVGCVLGEMFLRHPILPGNSDLDQLEKIWQMCGTPNQHTWPNFDTLPGCEGVKHHNQHPKRLKSVFEQFGVETCDLIDRLLTCNPGERITATQALEHDYFWTDPLPADPKTLPVYEASHEFDKRGRRQQPPQAPIAPRPTEPPHLPPPPMINNFPSYLNRGHPGFRPPALTRPGIPPPPGHQNPSHQSLEYRNGAPMNLPPIHYPAQGPPPVPYQLSNVLTAPLQPDQKLRVSHLPPRPPMPMGMDRSGDGRSRGGGRDNTQRSRGERDRNYAGLNYG